MKRQLLKGLLLALVVVLMLSGSVLATSYTYSIPTSFTENGTASYSNISLVFNIGITALQSAGYISSSALETGFSTSQHLVANDKVAFFVPYFAQGSTNIYYFYLGGDALLGSFPIITGYNGYVTVTDNASIELGDNFYIWVSGFTNLIHGSDLNIMTKPNAFYFVADNVTDGKVTFMIQGGATVAASGLSVSDNHTYEVLADTANLRIWVDGVLKDTVAMGGVGVPDTADNITIGSNNVMPYGAYIKLWKR